MPLVKVTYGKEEFELVADTIEELKKKISTELNEDQQDDDDYIEVGEDWSLFQFGFMLPNAPKTKLEYFKVDDAEIQLNLLEPEQGMRSDPRRIQNRTNRTRFIVHGRRTYWQTLHIPANQSGSINLERFRLSVNERFCIATNNYRDGDQEVQFDIYELNRNGDVVLEKLPGSASDVVKVYLLPENSPENSEVSPDDMLEPKEMRKYNIDHRTTPRNWGSIIVSGIFTVINIVGAAVL